MYTIEIAANSVQSCLNAQEGGAQRVELYANPYEGGVTPSLGTLREARKRVNIDIFVLVRPRGGDFFFSEPELATLLEDIRICIAEGADGIVSGALTQQGTIDVAATQQMVEACGGKPFTFHRAFDVATNLAQAVEDVIASGANRLLTSGRQPKAPEGIGTIQETMRLAGNRLLVMPGAGVGPANIVDLAKATGAKEFHLSAKTTLKSTIAHQPASPPMTGIPGMSSYDYDVSDVEKIKAVVAQLQGMA